jgi:hypothetical protein
MLDWGTSGPSGFIWEKNVGRGTRNRYQQKADVETVEGMSRNRVANSTIAWCKGYPQALPSNALSSNQ